MPRANPKRSHRQHIWCSKHHHWTDLMERRCPSCGKKHCGHLNPLELMCRKEIRETIANHKGVQVA